MDNTSPNMAMRRSPGSTIEWQKLMQICIKYWNDMIIFRMCRYIGLSQRQTTVLMIILSIIFIYATHKAMFGSAEVAEGVIMGKSDNKFIKSIVDSHHKQDKNIKVHMDSPLEPFAKLPKRRNGGENLSGKNHHKRKLLQYGGISMNQRQEPVRQPMGNNRYGQNQKLSYREEGFQNIQHDLEDPSKNLRIKFINRDVKKYVRYKEDIPLIWISGPPRSGTSFLRVLLDAHPDIRGGEETYLIHELFNLHKEILKDDAPALQRLEEANIDKKVLYNAMAAYILSIVTQHGEPAQYLCTKEPDLILQASSILEMFPKSKFVLVVRDGRAVVQSVSRRRLSNPMLSLNPLFHRANLQHWNNMARDMVYQCDILGSNKCMKIHYEDLVLHPRGELSKLLQWLDIPWSEDVLHHEQTIGKPGGAKLSSTEPSSEDFKQPINLQSLYRWADDFPEQYKQQADFVAPMLRNLGYDPSDYPPDYGTPDNMVSKNTQDLKLQKERNDQL